MIEKAWPVALHPNGAPLRLVAFDHPQTGLQLPSGPLLTDEHPERAASRILFETTGYETIATLALGTLETGGQLWHFTLCRLKPPIRDRWQHACKTDGGALLKGRLLPLDSDALQEPHKTAQAWIRAAL